MKKHCIIISVLALVAAAVSGLAVYKIKRGY